MNFWKVLKCGSVTLACLMLVSAFAASIVTVQADPTFPWGTITLHAVITSDPYWGRYGGYHDVLRAIQDELVNIGINLVIRTYDQYTWWDIVWDSGWNVSSEYQVPGMPPGIMGWDLTCLEWLMMPTGLIPLETMVYNEFTVPEGGFNVFPWMNEKADELLRDGQFTLDAETRKTYLGAWQELFMHDPPMVNLYYPRVYEVTKVWVEGWDAVVRFRDVSHLAINLDLQDDYVPWRLGTLIYGLGFEQVWMYNPLFMITSTEECMCDLWFETLYDLSIDTSEPVGEPPWDWPSTGVPPEVWQFFSKPALAADYPTWLDGPYGPNTRVRVPLRQNVSWSDCVPFNATDVKFTFDLILDPATGAVAYGEFEPVVERVEYVDGSYIDPYLSEKLGYNVYYDPWVVDFILDPPGNYADFAALLSYDWGLAMVPWHTLKDIAPSALSAHVSNVYPEAAKEWLPALGPFKLESVAPGPEITLVRNDKYFGYKENHPELDWGPYNVSKMVLISYLDPFDRLAALVAHEIDFCEYGTASKETFEALKAGSPGNGLRVWQYDRPSSNLLFFNLNGPKLSNRYVRQAIAHAIPYDYIYDVNMPNWGMEPYAGKTPITFLHYYTEPNTTEVEDPDLNGTRVRLFNEDNTLCPPYEHNITKALEYMKMWWYSTDPDYTQGPIGDADFSGIVELPDYYIWAAKIGTSPPWPFLPGCDIDPNFNNDAYVDIDDYYKWTTSWGFYYPEGSTTHEWSYYVP